MTGHIHSYPLFNIHKFHKFIMIAWNCFATQKTARVSIIDWIKFHLSPDHDNPFRLTIFSPWTTCSLSIINLLVSGTCTLSIRHCFRSCWSEYDVRACSSTSPRYIYFYFRDVKLCLSLERWVRNGLRNMQWGATKSHYPVFLLQRVQKQNE